MSEVVVSGSGLGAYRRVLSVGGAAAFCAPGAFARLSQAMLGLGAVLLITRLGGSFALAGLVAGAIALSQSAIAPWVSRLADERGQRRVLVPLLAVHTSALAGLVVAAEFGGRGWMLVALAVLAGSSLPQIGAFARARWTVLLGDGDGLRTALALESLIDEAAFVVGPVLVTALAAGIDPAAGLVAAIVIIAVAGLAFAAQHRSEPPATGGRDASAGRGFGPPRSHALGVIIVVFFGVGVVFGLIEVAVVAVAREHGNPSAAGVMLGLWATGSLLAGIAYGAIAWRIPARRRFVVAVAAFAAGTVLIAVTTESLLALTVALFIAGLANAPTLISGNTLVPASVSPTAVTEAYTWLTVSIFAGIAVGAPIAGAIIDHASGQAALAASIAAGAVTALTALLGHRALPASSAATP